MTPIKIHPVKSIQYTPFGGYHPMDLEYLNANGIEMTKDIDAADILLSQNRKHLKRYFYRYLKKKKYLIWTLEPRFNTSFKSVNKEAFNLVDCHIMNIYTGDVFVSPLSFTTGIINKQLQPLPDDFTLPNRTLVGLMSYYKGINTPKLMRNGVDIDLIKVRSAIGLKGHRQHAMDVFGRGWPEGISKEDSRSGDWGGRKGNILEDYYFNLCFENTVAENYVTEKIWDSIEGYCLPVYYGKGSGIYTLFPKDSFIDYSTLSSPEELFEMIATMPDKEYVRRMNACIDVYKDIVSKGESFALEERKLALDAIIKKVKQIVSQTDS